MIMGIFFTLQTERDRGDTMSQCASISLSISLSLSLFLSLPSSLSLQGAHLSSFMAILSGSVSPSNSTITGAPMLCVCACDMSVT